MSSWWRWLQLRLQQLDDSSVLDKRLNAMLIQLKRLEQRVAELESTRED
jgi:hypothetical protein